MIVDASVGLKWLVAEADSDVALEVGTRAVLIAPELLLSEIANAIWKKHRRGELSVVPPFAATLAATVTIVPTTPDLAERALRLALELGHSAYDCLYLALAEQRDMRLVTADNRFLRVCAESPYAALVVGLGAA